MDAKHIITAHNEITAAIAEMNTRIAGLTDNFDDRKAKSLFNARIKALTFMRDIASDTMRFGEEMTVEFRAFGHGYALDLKSTKDPAAKVDITAKMEYGITGGGHLAGLRLNSLYSKRATYRVRDNGTINVTGITNRAADMLSYEIATRARLEAEARKSIAANQTREGNRELADKARKELAGTNIRTNASETEVGKLEASIRIKNATLDQLIALKAALETIGIN